MRDLRFGWYPYSRPTPSALDTAHYGADLVDGGGHGWVDADSGVAYAILAECCARHARCLRTPTRGAHEYRVVTGHAGGPDAESDPPAAADPDVCAEHQDPDPALRGERGLRSGVRVGRIYADADSPLSGLRDPGAGSGLFVERAGDADADPGAAVAGKSGGLR
jgi:hypothetical protein